MTRITAERKVREGYVTVTLLDLVDDEGSPHHREVVSFGDSVCVLPYDPLRRVAMIVRLPRAPLLWRGEGELLIEAPAGMIEPGEDAGATARREALEEVGLTLSKLELVGACYPSPGVLAERSHLFLATYGEGDRRGSGGGLAEEHEGIAVEEISLRTLADMADTGQVCDMKTLVLVLALRQRRADLF